MSTEDFLNRQIGPMRRNGFAIHDHTHRVTADSRLLLGSRPPPPESWRTGSLATSLNPMLRQPLRSDSLLPLKTPKCQQPPKQGCAEVVAFRQSLPKARATFPTVVATVGEL